MFFRIKIYRVSLVCLMLVILDSSSALAQMTNLSIPPTEPAEPDFLVVPDISDERLLEESAYRLGAGDVLNIDIFRVPQYVGRRRQCRWTHTFRSGIGFVRTLRHLPKASYCDRKLS